MNNDVVKKFDFMENLEISIWEVIDNQCEKGNFVLFFSDYKLTTKKRVKNMNFGREVHGWTNIHIQATNSAKPTYMAKPTYTVNMIQYPFQMNIYSNNMKHGQTNMHSPKKNKILKLTYTQPI